jgi:glutamate 5-kinase
MVRGKRAIPNAKRIIVKVGTSTLTYPSGKLNLGRIESIAKELADLHNQGREVMLVSSGAIGAGMARLGLKERPDTIPGKQAAAAVGQGLLMHIYEKMFAEYGVNVAQILLTRDDLADRKRYLNARDTLFTLAQYGAVPIINENDTVAVESIKFGDNDLLAALVASLVGAELLVILSDIDGLYTANPQKDTEARLISLVDEITSDIEEIAGGAGSELGTGGMISKIYAAKIAVQSGTTMIIANGQEGNIIRRIIQGENIGTVFLAKENVLDSRKRWIAFGQEIQGRITVDDGAFRALRREGKSLLPTGIHSVVGEFERGNSVEIANINGRVFAKGLANYSSKEIEKIRGKQTHEISGILGYKYYDEVIHRDNLVIME